MDLLKVAALLQLLVCVAPQVWQVACVESHHTLVDALDVAMELLKVAVLLLVHLVQGACVE